MNYHNPLSIFSDSQLQHIYDGNLRAVKKELMLQFQLEESVTINLNGKELDKNGVIKLLEEIERDLGLHTEIFRNKDLLRFLEEGDLRLFENQTLEDDKITEKHYKLIIDKVIKKLNYITGNYIKQAKPTTNKKLKIILKFAEDLEPHQKMQAYLTAYEIIDKKVRKARDLFTSPFISPGKLAFHPEIHNLIDPTFYKQFQYLPEHFENIKRNYGIWCNNVVVVKSWKSVENLKQYDKNTLRTIRSAAEIASNHHNQK